MRYLPNILSFLRIPCAIVLLCTEPFSFSFFFFYFFCGISDILDGILARKMGTASKTGAFIDSLADAVFFSSLLVILLSQFQWPAWCLIFVGSLILIRLCSFAVGLIRFRKPAFLHTYANKAAGILLVLFVLLEPLLGFPFAAGIVLAFSGIAAVEELILNLTVKQFSPDVRGIIFRRRQARPTPSSRESKHQLQRHHIDHGA